MLHFIHSNSPHASLDLRIFPDLLLYRRHRSLHYQLRYSWLLCTENGRKHLKCRQHLRVWRFGGGNSHHGNYFVWCL